MKKISILLIAIFVLTISSYAQRYAIIDTRYILSKLSEYSDAQKKLDAFSLQWQKEIDRQTSIVGSDVQKLRS